MRRRLITLSRIIKAGLQNFFRNLTLGVAAMAVMVITLTIVLFSFIVNQTFSNTVTTITDKIDISVYLVDDITAEQREQLLNDLKNSNNVKSIEYISKDKALEIYKEQNRDNVDLLVAISQTDNPLPASIQIKPIDPNQIESIRQFLEQPDIKKLQSEETSYSGDRKDAIDKITQATKFFREAGFVGVIIFMLVSMLIIFNTIKMAIFNRREELTIMRLLGASTFYIRGPFIVETMIYGIVSGILSVFFVGVMFESAKTIEAASNILDIPYANGVFKNNFWLILIAQISIGVFIGAVSSYIATRRYLKFKSPK